MYSPRGTFLFIRLYIINAFLISKGNMYYVQMVDSHIIEYLCIFHKLIFKWKDFTKSWVTSELPFGKYMVDVIRYVSAGFIGS